MESEDEGKISFVNTTNKSFNFHGIKHLFSEDTEYNFSTKRILIIQMK